MLKIVGIALYAISGFFIYTVSLLSFTFMPSQTVAMKLGMMAIFGVIGLLVILVAMATSRFKAWKMPLGITLLAVAGFTIFSVFTILCMESSPELLKSIPDYPHNFFSDYTIGSITTALFIIVGTILVRSSPKHI